MKRMAEYLVGLPRRAKKALFLAQDVALCLLSIALAGAHGHVATSPAAYLSIAIINTAIVVVCHLPWIKLTSLHPAAIQRIGFAACLTTLAIEGLDRFGGHAALMPSSLLIGAIYFTALVLVRVVALQALTIAREPRGRRRIALYGAGTAGLQMAALLEPSTTLRPVLFLDDNPNLHRVMIGNLPVESPRGLSELRKRYRFDTVLLTMPSLDERRRDALIAKLRAAGLAVQLMPSLPEILSGPQPRLDKIAPAEILGRKSVELDSPEITRTYAKRTVLVTGAGGSIGSELCRQLLDCHVGTIVLFEHSEYALYSIEQDLSARAQTTGTRLLARLGSVRDADRVRQVLIETQPDIVLHAAAYKHVPMIEANPLEGAKNNILGTKTVVDAAIEAGVSRFVMISTDKAVRPANIMGASKRIAEQIVQDAQSRAPGTLFSMVRFGNVLGSSGSVLPIFQRQIQAGGPVTVTHPDVIRYFMTIHEAVRLVLLAGTYAEGSDVFVLDMGKPRRIVELAEQMIQLSGRTVRDPVTGIGDIEICFTGLRPGEKLYEELLIGGDNLLPTPHPKILRAQEDVPSSAEVDAFIDGLNDCLKRRDRAALRRLLADAIDGFDPSPAPGKPTGQS